MTISEIKWMQYTGTDPQPGFVTLYVDTAADLPTVAQIQAQGVDPLSGSMAITCDNGKKYLLDSSGTWNEVEDGAFSNVYTKTETDSMLSTIQTELDGLEISSLTAIDENAARPYTLRDLDFGRWVRTQNMTQCTDPPSDLAGAYVVYVETARVTNSRKMIRLFPVTTGAATKFYLTIETGAGVWTNWYRFDGTDTGS